MKYQLTRAQVSPNPTLEQAQHLLNQVKSLGPQVTEIESTGGGSTIDVGKYIAWKLKLPHTAIPTTAGSGSEVTKYAVFTIDGKKKTIEDEALIPTSYKLVPELVTSLPPLHTIAGGLDALAHAVESYWSPKATEESKRWAMFAINGITATLFDSYKNPQNEYLRYRMLESSNYAGRCINVTKTSICHALSYPLTSKRGTPHGIAVASTLPTFMRYFGFRSDLIYKTEKLLKDFKIERPKLTDEDIAEAMESERFYNTPKKVTKEILRDLRF